MDAQPTSIYAHVSLNQASQATRLSRRHRIARRLENSPDRPPLALDRVGPFVQTLRAYREGALDGPLQRLEQKLAMEVEALERWSLGRTRAQQKDQGCIRVALDFLKIFGRITALDFSSIPVEERALLVSVLALEHRWCYAAAGTTRQVFKVMIGRTGAR